jgi:hypothetical protein
MGKRKFYIASMAPNGLIADETHPIIATSPTEALAMSSVLDHGAAGQVYARVWGGNERVMYHFLSGITAPQIKGLPVRWGRL